MRYPNNLKALQAAQGWTIDEAAKAMAMSRGGYLKLQRGENRLTSTTIARAAQAFRVTVSDIVAASDSVTSSDMSEPTRAGFMEQSAAFVSEFVSTLASDGTTTLPRELREACALQPGDQIEFFQDDAGAWRIRPRNAGPLDFLKFLPPRAKRADALTDDEALTRAMRERNRPASAREPK